MLGDIIRSVFGESRENKERGPGPPQTRETQVFRLLEESEGRMWQTEIVRELGYSEASVSRTLSSMEDVGQIERYQIGRRNVVCLPGYNPLVESMVVTA